MADPQAPGSRPRFYRRCADIRFRIIDGEAVILRQAAAENLVLNEVGSSILQWLDSGCSLEKVARQVQEEYEVSPEQLAQDLPHFLEELENAGVVEPITDEGDARVEAGA